MDSTQILATYQTISQLTSTMADAARVGDWEKLTSLEQRCSALAAELKAAPPAKLDGEKQQQKIELIRKILADDAEIRSHTEPWMASLQKLLGDARHVGQAYNLDPKIMP